MLKPCPIHLGAILRHNEAIVGAMKDGWEKLAASSWRVRQDGSDFGGARPAHVRERSRRAALVSHFVDSFNHQCFSPRLRQVKLGLSCRKLDKREFLYLS